MQVAITLLMAFAFLLVSELLAPYEAPMDTWLSRVGHVIIFLSMYQALLQKVDVSGERGESQNVFAGVLLTANLCMLAAIFVETMLLMFPFRGCTTLKEDALPRSNHLQVTSSVEMCPRPKKSDNFQCKCNSRVVKTDLRLLPSYESATRVVDHSTSSCEGEKKSAY